MKNKTMKNFLLRQGMRQICTRGFNPGQLNKRNKGYPDQK